MDGVPVRLEALVFTTARNLAVVLFATTPLGFQWYPTVKTYALSTLLLFAAYVWAESSSARHWFIAGVFLGLAIDVRLLVASVVIVFLIYARRHAESS